MCVWTGRENGRLHGKSNECITAVTLSVLRDARIFLFIGAADGA